MNKNEKKMIEQIRKDFVARCLKGNDGCDLRDCQYCHAESLYNAGYRKVGEDEIVLKKSEYENLRLAQYNAQTTINENFLLALEKIEQAKQDTAREILQELNNRYNECGGAVDVAIMLYDWLSEMGKKYGIELED